MDEQFIQDAVSEHSRVRRIVNGLGYADWNFEDSDVLNQEFNFSTKDARGIRLGGRIDVIATFNGRSRLVIIENKLVANPDDLKQLMWYVENSNTIGQEAGFSGREAVGILLAHNFAPGSYKVDNPHIHCVRFRFDGLNFPFEVPALIAEESPEVNTSTVFKHSKLVTVEGHRSRLRSDLHEAFDLLRTLFLSANDCRLEWVVENPKSEHIAVHYKGVYVLYFFPRKGSFDFGYTTLDGREVRERISTNGPDATTILATAKADISTTLADIDERDTERRIPPAFKWSLITPE